MKQRKVICLLCIQETIQIEVPVILLLFINSFINQLIRRMEFYQFMNVVAT